jgi:hypothetical protein
MRDLSVSCDGCGSPCPAGEFLTLEGGAGSLKLKALWSDQQELCAECLEAVVNLLRQRRHGNADLQPVRRRA